MDDLSQLLTDQPAAPAARPRAPKAAPSVGLPPEQFAAIVADPSNLPSISKAGFSPEQETQFRAAWPMTNQPSQAVGNENAAARLGTLDRLNESGAQVFAAPKIDPKAHAAVTEYYKWLRAENKPASGEAAALLDSFKSHSNPIDALKGPARAQAVQLRDLVDHLKTAKDTGATKEDELHILTALLPAPGDKPEEIARKRVQFANQVEELAQGLPPQFWRAAAKNQVRARALRGTAPAAAPGAPAAEDGGSGLGYLKRALVEGATGLSLPLVAAIKTAMHETPEEGRAGADMMLPRSVKDTTTPIIPRGPSVSDEIGALRDTRAQNLGQPNAAALEEQDAADKLEHPVGARVAGFGGAMLDPVNVLLGLPGKAYEGLSPVARVAIAHALPGATAGGLAAAGAGGGAGDVAKGAGVGALIGTVLGKGAEHILSSPGRNEAIARLTDAEARAMKMTPAQLAERKAALEADTFASPEATKAAIGVKAAQTELGPKIQEWKQQLFAKHGVQPGSKLDTAFNVIEDATLKGDVEAAAKARAAWDAEWNRLPVTGASAELRKDANALLNIAAVKHSAESGEHSLGANFGTARPESAMEQNPTVGGAIRLAPMAAGGNRFALRAMVAGGARGAVNVAAKPMQAALARLYLAKQAGNMTAVQQAVEDALKIGVPFSAVNQIAGQFGGGDQ